MLKTYNKLFTLYGLGYQSQQNSLDQRKHVFSFGLKLSPLFGFLSVSILQKHKNHSPLSRDVLSLKPIIIFNPYLLLSLL